LTSSTSIVPKQNVYNSRYFQQIELENIKHSLAPLNKDNKEISKLYLSKFINYNLKSLIPGIDQNNVILSGIQCHILDVIFNTVYVLVSPGVMIVDDTLLFLNKPQILSINVSDYEDVEYLVLFVDYKFEMSINTGNQNRIFNKTIIFDRREKYTPPNKTVTDPSTLFSLKLFSTSKENKNLQNPPFGNENWIQQNKPLLISIFKPYYKDKIIYHIDQYLVLHKNITNLLNKYKIEYDYDYYKVNNIVSNNTKLDLLSINLNGEDLHINRFSFISKDIKDQFITNFKYGLLGRQLISDIPFYTNTIERSTRIGSIYHAGT